MSDEDRFLYGAQKAPTVRTWDVLTSLGFKADESIESDPPGALSYDFGNTVVTAIHCLTPRLVNVVLLTGTIRTPRTLSQLRGEIPQSFENREIGVAWLTWCLDNAVKGEFVPREPALWLAEGRVNRSLLPWSQRQTDRDRR